ncbi:MAG TPA: tetratricopeptide repeat protein [Marinagarivorans sp.]|nr:tetratricopeptide repeat protein [Marinagarivorans sp.]
MLLAGCAETPSKEAKPEAITPDPSGKIAQVIPNPYLQHAGDAPAAAKTEFTRIQGLIKNGRSADAITALTKMRQDYPKLSGPAVNLALLYWKQKNYAQAQTAFEQAQGINKYNPDAYTQYAIMLREQGKFTEAEAQYLKALAVWPHNVQAHRDLGVLYDLYLVQPEKALQHFTLCDQLSAEPNKEIKGWIIELNRRLNKKPAPAPEAKLEGAP